MMMKTIKINYTGMWSGLKLITAILKERYNVEISDKPDYLLVSPLGNPYTFMNYDCVRILFTGEPLTPDFNVFDYAIGFDYMAILDTEDNNRYYRFPLCFRNVEGVKEATRGLTRTQAETALREKKYFCNFIYSHRSAKGEREAILDALQKYKRIEVAGSFLNNMPGGAIIPYEGKVDFLRICKFTIACESIRYPGFVTEKIVDPFFAHSVPLYYGNPMIDKEFNTEAMIHLGSFPTLEEGIEKVIEVDQDDEKYMKILMTPKLKSESYLDDLYIGLKQFLFQIFDQEKEDAYRRLRFYVQKKHEDCLREYAQFYNSPEYRGFKTRQIVIQRIRKAVNGSYLVHRG